MAEPAVTGGRDDLRLVPSRCVRARYRHSTCTKCVDACPPRAIKIAAGPVVDEKGCSGCLLCTVVCPVGAMERSSVLPSRLSRLAEVRDPLLGCPNSEAEVDAVLPCLGGLSEEQLYVLADVAQGRLSIDVSRCSSCANGVIEAQVRSRSATVVEAGLVAKERLPRFVASGEAVKRLEVGLDRRGFFKAFRKSVLTGAKSLLASVDERELTEMSYGKKSLPVKRMLLNAFRQDAGPDLGMRIAVHFDARAVFSAACSGCFACAAACPTGALTRTSIRETEPPHGLVPGFDPTACVSCGLCEEFCPEKAVTILPLRAEVKETAGLADA